MLASCNSRRGLTRLRRTIVTLMTTLRPPMCNKSSSVWLTLHDGQHPLEYYHTCARGNTVNEPDPPRPLMVAVLQCYDAATTHYSSLTKLWSATALLHQVTTVYRCTRYNGNTAVHYCNEVIILDDHKRIS